LAPDKLHAVSIGSNPNSYHDIALVEALGRSIDEKALPIELHLFGRSAELCSDHTPRSLRLHGRVSHLDMPRYLAHMDVGLALYNIPLDLGSPMKLFDYLASGCVPVCSEGQAVEEVLAGTDAGFVEAGWTPEKLSGVLMKLHQDRAMLEAMRTAGRRLVEQEYNWRRIAEKTMELLSQLVHGGGRAAETGKTRLRLSAD
jgi:glycosyltransferase involved in cell wall biosynthesis